jgi:hypothetical protein
MTPGAFAQPWGLGVINMEDLESWGRQGFHGFAFGSHAPASKQNI